MNTTMFERAKWIWDDSDPEGYHYYLQARRTFHIDGPSPSARLRITADAMYQAWLNGEMVGHGPTKAAEGMRFVDEYDLTPLLKPGENCLEMLVLCLGVSTMTYCMGRAGLIFELALGDRIIASDEQTMVRRDPRRLRQTVRRWILPCIEDVDAAADATGSWKPAVVVTRDVQLLSRRVPLPTRQVLIPQRPVLADEVRLPNFAVSLRYKRYLTDPAEWRRHNQYDTPGYIVTDIHSPIEQELRFVPTLGSVHWFFEGEAVFAGSGWSPWMRGKIHRDRIHLRAGANRLIGLHTRDHFEHVNLAGFVEQPIECRNPFGAGGFQVIPMTPETVRQGGELQNVDWEKLRPQMPVMRAEDTIINANAYDLVSNAEPCEQTASFGKLLATPLSQPLELPAAQPGHAVRLLLDLGVLENGWIELDVEGESSGRLILAFLEAVELDSPLRIQWPAGCNNALTYRLRAGRQRFESFHPYGVRYIAIHNAGPHPIRVHGLRIRTANCGSRLSGSLLTEEPLLNQVYQIAVQSTHSAVDDTFTDCPTFEQVNWNFDNRTAWQGEVLSSANLAVAAHSIRLFAEDPRSTGLVPSQYPSTWDNYIPIYCFHWIMWCRDYYRHSGDAATIRAVFPRISAGIAEAIARIGGRGLLSWSGVWHFVEWGRGRDDDHAINAAEQAGFAGALDAAIALGEELNLASSAQLSSWRQVRQDVIGIANELLWNPACGAYADSLHDDGRASDVSTQATNAAMAIYGIADAQRSAALARRIADNDPGLLPFGSPLGQYYVMELLDSVGDVESIFRQIRHRWGDMVRAGDTTMWELFAEYGFGGFPTRSRCHPCAGYVIKYLVKYLLGVRMLDTAFRRFTVAPNPPAGVDRCQGSVPTPDGPIHVHWERRGDGIDLRVLHPQSLRREM